MCWCLVLVVQDTVVCVGLEIDCIHHYEGSMCFDTCIAFIGTLFWYKCTGYVFFTRNLAFMYC